MSKKKWSLKQKESCLHEIYNLFNYRRIYTPFIKILRQILRKTICAKCKIIFDTKKVNTEKGFS